MHDTTTVNVSIGGNISNFPVISTCSFRFGIKHTYTCTHTHTHIAHTRAKAQKKKAEVVTVTKKNQKNNEPNRFPTTRNFEKCIKPFQGRLRKRAKSLKLFAEN
jgi:hypothetical protein